MYMHRCIRLQPAVTRASKDVQLPKVTRQAATALAAERLPSYALQVQSPVTCQDRQVSHSGLLDCNCATNVTLEGESTRLVIVQMLTSTVR